MISPWISSTSSILLFSVYSFSIPKNTQISQLKCIDYTLFSTYLCVLLNNDVIGDFHLK